MGHYAYWTTTTVVRGCWAGMFAYVLAACGSDVDMDAASACAAALPSEPCDVRQVDCQRSVLALVAAERGEPVPPLPSIRIDTPDEKPTSPSSPLITVGFSWDSALVALGLLPVVRSSTHARDELLETYNAWYYDYEAQEIVVHDYDVLPQDPRDAMSRLAHELDHYMQDRSVGIAALYEGHNQDVDHTTAKSTLIEGEAMMVGFRVQARLYGEDPDAVEWGVQLHTYQESYLARIDASNAPLSTAMNTLNYTLGARYISKLWAAYGRAQVDRLFSASPEVMVDWLSDSVAGALAPTRLEPVGCDVPAAPDGFELQGTTSLGMLGALVLTAAGGGARLNLASQLRGDSLSYYAAVGPSQDFKLPSERGIAVWDLLFADAESARQFALNVQNAPILGRWTGRRVRVLASRDPALLLLQLFKASPCP